MATLIGSLDAWLTPEWAANVLQAAGFPSDPEALLLREPAAGALSALCFPTSPATLATQALSKIWPSGDLSTWRSFKPCTLAPRAADPEHV